jgi:hypothetical protein
MRPFLKKQTKNSLCVLCYSHTLFLLVGIQAFMPFPDRFIWSVDFSPLRLEDSASTSYEKCSWSSPLPKKLGAPTFVFFMYTYLHFSTSYWMLLFIHLVIDFFIYALVLPHPLINYRACLRIVPKNVRDLLRLRNSHRSKLSELLLPLLISHSLWPWN